MVLQMSEPVSTLYDKLLACRASKQVKFKDELLVLEGIASVVSTLPAASARCGGLE